MKTLAGKVALVTGGPAGCDASIARALADDGAAVAISYVGDAHEAEALVGEFRAREIRSAAFLAECCEMHEVERLFNLVAKHFGTVDLLIWPPPTIHVAVTHRVRAGREAAFQQALPCLCR